MTNTNFKNNIALFIFTIYLILLLKITVLRSGINLDNLFTKGEIHLIPFINLYMILQRYGVQYFLYLFVGNIIWFAPFGFFLSYLYNVKPSKIILYGFLLSLSIELLQYIFGTGVSEIDDLILNTLGTIVGYLIFIAIKKMPQPRKR